MGQPQTGRSVVPIQQDIRRTSHRGNLNGSPSGSRRLGRYLRELREGYGLSLRRVERRARTLGQAIDNSQLSRFEKGKALPSLEKLRVLARIFNVSLQQLADLLELDGYDSAVPETGDYETLMNLGRRSAAEGELGTACVAFERAAERAESAERCVRATRRMSAALARLGLTEWSERSLRALLRRRSLAPAVRRRIVLQLARLCRDSGDDHIASVLVRDCLAGARSDGDRAGLAAALQTLGDLQLDAGDARAALASYGEALAAHEKTPVSHETGVRLRAWVNSGACLIALGRQNEALAVLRKAHATALAQSERESAALALTRMAEALRGMGDLVRARSALQESEALASEGVEHAEELLFLNAYQRWAIARQERNGAREKWALDRMRSLRPGVRGFRTEASLFDRFNVERDLLPEVVGGRIGRL